MRDTDRQPIINITGESIALGPLRRDLISTYHHWNNNLATTRTYAMRVPSTLDQDEAAYTSMTSDPSTIFFTIYERASWDPIGITYLTSIDYRHRTAEFCIMIGETDRRGRGYGTEVACLMLDYAFTALGLHNVMLTVYEFNLAGRRAYEKAGFKECGRRHQCHSMSGRLWDEITMECLATDFTSPVLSLIFAPDSSRRNAP